jgi:CHRD domain-containing protein
MMRKSIVYILPVLITAASIAIVFTPPVIAQQETRAFSVILMAANEVPPVSNVESGASGVAYINLVITRDGGGTIIDATASFDATINGVNGSANIILAHVHQGAAGVNGSVRVDSGISPANPVPVVNGNAKFTRTGLFTSPDIAQAIIDDPAGFYFNVHSPMNPEGVVRGQLLKLATGGSASPLPGTSSAALNVAMHGRALL